MLDDIADAHTRLVLETPAGARVVVMSEADYLSLRTGGDGSGAKSPTKPLTGREVEILSLVAKGNSGAAIAAQLGLAPNTVAQHLVSVRRKLGVATTAAAVDIARRLGVLQ
jgi:DNA-binding CsgD family transcriptional regulator